MKATGIVRRIDDLGRVVIPKEIRRTLRIREGDALEIFTDAQGGVIFKKYSPVEKMQDIAQKYVDVISSVYGASLLVCDWDEVIAVAGDIDNNLIGQRVEINSKKLYPYIETLTKDIQVTCPIKYCAEVIGYVIILKNASLKDENAILAASTLSQLIVSQLENG